MDISSLTDTGGPEFDVAFRERLRDLFLWRRDVRRFRRDPLPEDALSELLALAALAPSVGYSQPWRFVLVEDPVEGAVVDRATYKQHRVRVGSQPPGA